jgi:hypothetical protein
MPEKFRALEKDLVSAHNVEEIAYGRSIKVEV